MKFYKSENTYILSLTDVLLFEINPNTKQFECTFSEKGFIGVSLNKEITKEESMEACKPLLEKTGLIKLFEDSDSKDVLGKTQWQRTAEELYKENERLKKEVSEPKNERSIISNFEKAIKNRDKNLEELAKRESVYKDKIKSLKEELREVDKEIIRQNTMHLEVISKQSEKIKDLESVLKHYL